MRSRFFIISFLIIIFDQLTKIYFKYNSYDLRVLQLHFVKNYGAGFGILQNQRLLLILIPILVIFLIFYYLKEIKQENFAFYAMLFLLAGTIGNLIDRIFFGYVTDFIDLGFWPVFNIADISNVVAGILIVISLIKKE